MAQGTGVPLDERAPERNHRWVEILNVGGQQIPPYGVVEIVSASRPEGDQSGRTAISVRRPTQDNSCCTLINGHTPIDPGKTGWGTADLPTYAIYDTGSPQPCEEWGSARNSFGLKLGHRGYLVIGDAHVNLESGQQVVRVMRRNTLVRFRIKENYYIEHYNGAHDAPAYVMRPAGTSWVQTSTEIQVYDDDQQFVILEGEEGWAELKASDGSGCVHHAVSGGDVMRRAKNVGTIPCDSMGTVQLYSTSPGHDSCTAQGNHPQVQVCNLWGWNRPIYTSPETEELWVRWQFDDRKWHIMPLERNRHILATAYANFHCNDAVVAIVDPEPLDTCDPNVDAIVELKNLLGLGGCAGDLLIGQWRQTDNTWILAQVQHHEHEIMENIFLECEDTTCTFYGQFRKYCLPGCQELTDFPLIQGERATFVSDTYSQYTTNSSAGSAQCQFDTTFDFYKSRKTACFFCLEPASEGVGGTSSVFTLDLMEVVTDLNIDLENCLLTATVCYALAATCGGGTEECREVPLLELQGCDVSGGASGACCECGIGFRCDQPPPPPTPKCEPPLDCAAYGSVYELRLKSGTGHLGTDTCCSNADTINVNFGWYSGATTDLTNTTGGCRWIGGALTWTECNCSTQTPTPSTYFLDLACVANLIEASLTFGQMIFINSDFDPNSTDWQTLVISGTHPCCSTYPTEVEIRKKP